MKHKYFLITKTLPEYGVSTYQELWKKAQDEGCEALKIMAPTAFKKAEGDESENRFSFVFSSEKEDRHGDIVRQNFELKYFKKNPVFLDSHNYWSIEAIIGRVENLSVKSGALSGDVVYALENPRGVLARDLTAGGFLNATSIGFIPKEFSDKGEIMKSELLEISAVSVPAQAEATIIENSIEPTEESETPPEPENAPVRASKPSVRSSYLQAVKNVDKANSDRLKRIAAAVAAIDMNSTKRHQQKRDALQAIRSLTSTDN